MPRVLVAGYLSIDTLAGHAAMPGGAALYAALGARRAGADAAISAAVGEDYPQPWLDALARLGIDVSGVERRGGPTRRARMDYHAPQGRDPEWWARTRALAPPISDLRAETAVAGPMPADALARFLAAAGRVGVPVVADTSDAYAGPDAAALLALLPQIAVFAPSLAETRLLLPGLDDDAAACALARLGPAVLQKRGAAGALLVAGSDPAPLHLPAPEARAADPTGAGDATVGALAAGLAAGLDLADAARAALRVGALAVSAAGPAALGFQPGEAAA